MCKRGNYFIAMYDNEDNYIRDFESIEECALYFGYTRKNLNDYILRKKLINDKFKLYKFIDDSNLIQYNFSRKVS